VPGDGDGVAGRADVLDQAAELRLGYGQRDGSHVALPPCGPEKVKDSAPLREAPAPPILAVRADTLRKAVAMSAALKRSRGAER
jgi:hypothetical protein